MSAAGRRAKIYLGMGQPSPSGMLTNIAAAGMAWLSIGVSVSGVAQGAPLFVAAGVVGVMLAGLSVIARKSSWPPLLRRSAEPQLIVVAIVGLWLASSGTGALVRWMGAAGALIALTGTAMNELQLRSVSK